MGVVERLAETVAEHAVKLDEIVEEGVDLDDWRQLYLVLHLLQVQAQALIDLALRATALLGLQASTPIDAADKLYQHRVLSRQEAEKLKRIVRFRNIVVHEYASIDASRVKAILESRGYREAVAIAYTIARSLLSRGLDP